MIRISIEADTPEQVRRDMQKLLGALPAGDPKPASEETLAEAAKPVADTKAGRGKKAISEAPEKSETSEKAATSPDKQSSAADEETIDPRVRARTLGSKLIDLGGTEQLKQVFGEFGATKFPEVPDDKLEAFSIRVEELIAAQEG